MIYRILAIMFCLALGCFGMLFIGATYHHLALWVAKGSVGSIGQIETAFGLAGVILNIIGWAGLGRVVTLWIEERRR